MADKFTWIDAYQAIANALYAYNDKRDELLHLFNELFSIDGADGKMRFPGNGSGKEQYDAIDPFTFFSTFNRGVATPGYDKKRIQVLTKVIEALNLDVQVPSDFAGVPINFNIRSWFFDGSLESIANGDVDRLWDVFIAAVDYADNPNENTRAAFVQTYNAVRNQPLLRWNITYALFWIRPYTFVGLDSVNREYLSVNYGIDIKNQPAGEQYLQYIQEIKDAVGVSFPVFSDNAFVSGGWWPAREIYDPGISVEQWRRILQTKSLVSDNCLVALSRLRLYGGEATCSELASRFGQNKNFFNSNISTASEKIVDNHECDQPPLRESGDNRWWPVLCLGKRATKKHDGSYIYKLRPELKEALDSLDLSDAFTLGYDPDKLNVLISSYKNNFKRFRGPDAPDGDQESYKWALVTEFQDNWDIDADDFASAFRKALGPAAKGQGAVLGNGWEYPYNRLNKLLDFNPEGVRDAFRLLLDPEKDLRDACDSFGESIDALLADYNAKHENQLDKSHQTYAAISIYLSFAMPERYYYHKPSVTSAFMKYLGVQEPFDSFEAFSAYEGLCSAILPVIRADEELLQLNASALSEEQLAADPAYHMLAQDIAFYCYYYMNQLPLEVSEMEEKPMYPKNMILYGPPGTGKTYQTKAYAVAICEGKSVDNLLKEMATDEGYKEVSKRYKKLQNEGRIGFTTFHQSYGYEEFIEGIRPEYDEDSGSMSYPVKPGVFCRFCNQADDVVAVAAETQGVPRFEDNPNPRVWKMGLQTTEEPDLFQKCQKDGCLRMGWDEVEPDAVADSEEISIANRRAITAFQDGMQPGDFVVIPGGDDPAVYRIAVVTGDFEWKESFKHAKRYRSAKWISSIGKAAFRKMNGNKALTLQTVYELTRITPAQLLEAIGLAGTSQEEDVANSDALPYVFIIDEINRGNISKVFGELITLIEESKRKGMPEEMAAVLPYSGKDFSVPANVYIIGTMNTADRSIALMDTALRRRFTFREIMPDTKLLEGVTVEGVNVQKILETMNARIELLYDREHTLGHAYFLPLKADASIDCLAKIFRERIIPLLQEYFYDDYTKIRSVFGAAANEFVAEKDSGSTFWVDDVESYSHLKAFSVVNPTPIDPATYARIYQVEGEE